MVSFLIALYGIQNISFPNIGRFLFDVNQELLSAVQTLRVASLRIVSILRRVIRMQSRAATHRAPRPNHVDQAAAWLGVGRGVIFQYLYHIVYLSYSNTTQSK